MRRAALIIAWIAGAPGAALAAPPAPAPVLAPADVADGVVQRYLHTPYGEVNGLRLTDGVLVLMSPPMASSVADTAPIGAHIRIAGQTAPDGVVRAEALINLGTGKSTDAGNGPAPPPVRPALARCEVDGFVELVLHGPRGEANGVILTDSSIVYFRPDLAPPGLAPGQPFAAVGIGTETPSGLAMEAIVAGADGAAVRAEAATATVFNRLTAPAPAPAPPRAPPSTHHAD